jgi:hypothetical protein
MKRPFLTCLLFSYFLLLTGCTDATPTPVMVRPSPQPVVIGDAAGLSPEQVVNTFYSWYLTYPGNALVDGAYTQTGYLTTAFDQQLGDLLAAPPGLGFDPLLCAQDHPAWVRVDDVMVAADEATVTVGTSFSGHTLQLRLRLEVDVWRIDDVLCSPPQQVEGVPGSPLQVESGGVRLTGHDGQIYQNDRFQFQLALPPAWHYQELALSAGGAPPGPPNIYLMILLMPQAWAEGMAASEAADPARPVLAPFTLELSIGSLDEYRQSYPEPDHSEAVAFNGLPVIREEQHFGGELRIIHYVVAHPADENLRVTFVDPITGFPERLAGNEAVVDEFEAIMESFEWIGRWQQ